MGSRCCLAVLSPAARLNPVLSAPDLTGPTAYDMTPSRFVLLISPVGTHQPRTAVSGTEGKRLPGGAAQLG